MRKLAREVAFKIIYKSYFLKDDLTFEEILEAENITPELDKEFEEDNKFITDLINLYAQNKQDIQQIINSKLSGYTPDRVFKIDRAIMELAVTEIKFYGQTPYKVVINEAVEIAKKYSTEKSYSFVNGILKSVVEELNVN